MSDNPYDYENRHGIRPISWEEFHGLCKGLVVAIAPFKPEIILPIGRAGYYPGTLIAHLLQAELYPIRLSRRVNDVVTYRDPIWLIKPPQLVEGRRVLIVDEICSTGQTISIAKEDVIGRGAFGVRSAVLYSHTQGAAVPDYIGLISDALILNPWDREIWQDGHFLFHPEYSEALKLQGWDTGTNMFIDAGVVKAAKG